MKTMKMMMQMPTMMEILSMARNLLVDRYQEQKYQCVIRWQMQNEYAWSTGSDIVPCADMPEYPTADEILALVRHLAAYFAEYINEDSDQSSAEMPFPVTQEFPKSDPAAESTVDHPTIGNPIS